MSKRIKAEFVGMTNDGYDLSSGEIGEITKNAYGFYAKFPSESFNVDVAEYLVNEDDHLKVISELGNVWEFKLMGESKDKQVTLEIDLKVYGNGDYDALESYAQNVDYSVKSNAVADVVETEIVANDIYNNYVQFKLMVTIETTYLENAEMFYTYMNYEFPSNEYLEVTDTELIEYNVVSYTDIDQRE
jgi:hypothetical protein